MQQAIRPCSIAVRSGCTGCRVETGQAKIHVTAIPSQESGLHLIMQRGWGMVLVWFECPMVSSGSCMTVDPRAPMTL